MNIEKFYYDEQEKMIEEMKREKERNKNEKVYLFNGHGLHPWLLHCL